MGKKLKPCLLLAAGITLTTFAVVASWSYGQLWISGVQNGDKPWPMNNWFSVPCWTAYLIFGVFFLWSGGVFSGITLAAGIFHRLFTKKRWKKAFTAIGFSVVFTGLGFNTLDWTCGWIYFNQGNPNPQNFLGVSVEPWSYYFFVIVCPLWLSGFLLSLAAVWLGKLHKSP